MKNTTKNIANAIIMLIIHIISIFTYAICIATRAIQTENWWLFLCYIYIVYSCFIIYIQKRALETLIQEALEQNKTEEEQ